MINAFKLMIVEKRQENQMIVEKRQGLEPKRSWKSDKEAKLSWKSDDRGKTTRPCRFSTIADRGKTTSLKLCKKRKLSQFSFLLT